MVVQDSDAAGGKADPPSSPEQDAELWVRAGAGDEAARGWLARQAESVARSELARRGARDPDLADLAQEAQRSTFAFLARNPPAPRDLRTFLKYRAWGVLSDQRKKMRASPLDYRDDLEPLLRERPADRPDPLRAKELAAALQECRKRLPHDLGRVLALRYDTGAGTDAIESSLGVHRNTIRVRVFRALERLRDCLGAKGFGAEDVA